MKYWRGYLTAGILLACTWALREFAKAHSVLVDMIYPYVTRMAQVFLSGWSSGVDFCVWQMLLLTLIAVILATAVLMIILKWNPIRWGGWVCAVVAAVIFLNTGLYSLNEFSGPLSEDIRLKETDYTITELESAAVYYRDQVNALADQISRDEKGNVKFADFATLAQQAGNGFEHLVYDNSYSVFAGSNLPVKELGWADMYTSMGITGVTMGLTGEAAVNPQIPDVTLPFTICHEMAHRKCIAVERDANFAAFLACQANESIEYQYSAYFMAFRYCYSTLASAGTTETVAAAARVHSGISQQLMADLEYYDDFFHSRRSDSATDFANKVNDTYLKTSGDEEGTKSYSNVSDLLVWWHYQQIFLPEITVEESHFDPLDESQVDLSGIINAKEEEPVEEGVG